MMGKVLIVDDNEGERFIIKRTLIKLGVEVESILEAKNGEEGYDIIDNGKIEVVLLDINMPKLSGLELLRMIRRDKFSPPPYIVMLTTSQNDDDLGSSIEGGADGFSVKPNAPSKMKEILSAIKIIFIDKQHLTEELCSVFQYLKNI